MPLSEHEQRLLEEMERNLYHNDAEFVASVGRGRGKPNYTFIVVGILVALLGVGVIVAGVIVRQPLIGIAGFVLIVGGALLALSRPRRSSPPQEPSAAERASASARASASGPTRGGFMDRMNERWDKRQDGRDERE
jgi:Protein of unknown function (DUF3040)